MDMCCCNLKEDNPGGLCGVLLWFQDLGDGGKEDQEFKASLTTLVHMRPCLEEESQKKAVELKKKAMYN